MIYMDNAATTAVSKKVLDAMMPYLTDEYANPSSIHSFGQKSRQAIENSRRIIANAINAREDEIFFTSGGSESDNLAIKGCLNKNKKQSIITSSIEHEAVLKTCKFLEDNNLANIEYLNVDQDGFINPNDLRACDLISVMSVNNEVGTIQPIKKIARYARENGILFHTDAVQALGHMKIDVEEIGADMMSFSGHKIHAPKGIGFLYVNKSVNLSPLIHGGSQEQNLRAGTENTAFIVGLAKAVSLSYENLDENIKKMQNLRDYMIKKLLNINNIRLNGSMEKRICNNINISILNIKTQRILPYLDISGICISAGSACTAGSIKPSHVLTAMNLPSDRLENVLRISLSHHNTREEADMVIKKIDEAIKKFAR